MTDIKPSRAIPEGYTYTRCDVYTAEEFIAKYTSDKMRKICEEYVRENPKEQYNTDDEIALHRIVADRSVPGLIHGQYRSTTKKSWYHGD